LRLKILKKLRRASSTQNLLVLIKKSVNRIQLELFQWSFGAGLHQPNWRPVIFYFILVQKLRKRKGGH